MLLIITAAFLVALGLQLRARPLQQPAGYYLGADGVICMTSWKVVQSPRPRPRAHGSIFAPAAVPTANPWGAAAPPHAGILLGGAPSPPQDLAEPSAAGETDVAAFAPPPTPPSGPIIVPAGVLAELEQALPPAWVRPRRPDRDFDRQGPPPAAAFGLPRRAPAHSMTLH